MLDNLLNRFIEINTSIEAENNVRQKTKKNTLMVDFYLKRKQFSKQFIDFNCKIQIVRSDNQTLIDDIILKKEDINIITEELERKLQVEQEFNRRLKLIRLRKKNN